MTVFNITKLWQSIKELLIKVFFTSAGCYMSTTTELHPCGSCTDAHDSTCCILNGGERLHHQHTHDHNLKHDIFMNSYSYTLCTIICV